MVYDYIFLEKEKNITVMKFNGRMVLFKTPMKRRLLFIFLIGNRGFFIQIVIF